jgi:hypothetical protein
MGLWIRSGNKNAVFTMGWKKFTETEKVTVGQVELESHIDGFLFVHHEFICKGKTMNRYYYLEMLKQLRENIRREIPHLWRNNSWFLHHDNAPAHASLLFHDFLASMNSTVLPQPPYTSLTWP